MSVTCLVADDSLFARMLVKNAVSEIFSDVSFIEASSGKESLKKYFEAGKNIDWFLLDVNMGSPDGVKTAAKLMEQDVEREKIALITGNKSVELQEKAADMGVRYISKAINPNDVNTFIAKLKCFFYGESEEGAR